MAMQEIESYTEVASDVQAPRGALGPVETALNGVTVGLATHFAELPSGGVRPKDRVLGTHSPIPVSLTGDIVETKRPKVAAREMGRFQSQKREFIAQERRQVPRSVVTEGRRDPDFHLQMAGLIDDVMAGEPMSVRSDQDSDIDLTPVEIQYLSTEDQVERMWDVYIEEQIQDHFESEERKEMQLVRDEFFAADYEEEDEITEKDTRAEARTPQFEVLRTGHRIRARKDQPGGELGGKDPDWPRNLHAELGENMREIAAECILDRENSIGIDKVVSIEGKARIYGGSAMPVDFDPAHLKEKTEMDTWDSYIDGQYAQYLDSLIDLAQDEQEANEAEGRLKHWDFVYGYPVFDEKSIEEMNEENERWTEVNDAPTAGIPLGVPPAIILDKLASSSDVLVAVRNGDVEADSTEELADKETDLTADELAELEESYDKPQNRLDITTDNR